jgi:cell shape-determining protein MreC
MIMSYKFGRKKKSNWPKVFGFLALVLLVFFLRKPVFKLFGHGASVVAEPVWGVSQFLSGEVTEGFLLLQSKNSLASKLLELQDKFKEFSGLVKERDLLLEENKELKQLLSLKTEYSFTDTARVLSRPPRISYDTFLIDLGSLNGVEEGDLVFVENSVLVGFVSDVRLGSSVVELMSSPGFESEVRLLSSDLALSVSGTGGGSFRVNVPKGIEVSEGSQLVSVYDSSFLVAEVVRVIGDPQDPSQTVIAKAPFNMHYVNNVFLKRF